MKIIIDGIKFESFSDGVCNIYTTDEEGIRIDKHTNLCFGNRVLGYGRVFEAKAHQIEVNRVIRIPNIQGVDNYDYVEIDGTKYGVKLVQNIYNTNPPSIDLTLDKAR